MNSILPFANLNDYWKSRRQLNWCRVNSNRNQSINVSLPIINSLLGAQRISASEARYDETTLILGNNPFHIMPVCSQKINEDNIITDISDFSNLTLDDCVGQLNRLSIHLPFVVDTAERVITHKLFAQKVPAKANTSEEIWRYANTIQVIAIYEDLVRPTKEFPSENIQRLLTSLYSSIDVTDMTNQIIDWTDYDLTNLQVLNQGDIVGWDRSEFVMTKIDDLQNFIMDFTNLYQDHTISIDITNQVIYKSPFDQSFIIFGENVLGDITNMIQSYLVPIQSRTILSDKLPSFFRTSTDGLNEQVSSAISIPYGTYIRDLLRFYYQFNDNIIKLYLQLVLAQILRNATDDLAVAEINQLLSLLTGSNKSTGWTATIKSIENQLSMFLVDMTGISAPVIYHNEHVDFTSDVTMSTQQTLDDIYTIMSQINNLRFVYVIDFGYGENLQMSPSSVLMSMDSLYSDSGYLSMFLGINQIEL